METKTSKSNIGFWDKPKTVTAGTNTFEKAGVYHLALSTQPKNWRAVNVWDVEFFDRTDGVNNLVRETPVLAYLSGCELRGNILFAQNAMHDTALIMVKEAPCSSVQLHYPGYDYVLVLREYNEMIRGDLALYDLAGQSVRFEHITGQGKEFETRVGSNGEVTFVLPSAHSSALYQYRVKP
ncbi:MAG: hypothetical protein GY809_06040 [Planctomycetes bacterium]|nr:hypothetical protein [Planctomycetota bacterium]